MKLSELEQKIVRSIHRIDTELEQQAAIAGNDLVALISNRVIQRGETADGGTFSPYSTAQVPAFFYTEKSRTSSANNAVKQKAKKGEALSYKEFRGINNLNTTPKNFEFTGEMWRGFGVIGVARSAKGIVLTIGGKTKESEDRIRWNSEKERKSIIKPSKEEIAIVTANLKRWLKSILNG